MSGIFEHSEFCGRLARIMNTSPLHVWELTDPQTYGYMNTAHAFFLGADREKAAGLQAGLFSCCGESGPGLPVMMLRRPRRRPQARPRDKVRC